jgi:hypothetical protein
MTEMAMPQHIVTLLITYLTTKLNMQYTYPRNMENSNVYKPLNALSPN